MEFVCVCVCVCVCMCMCEREREGEKVCGALKHLNLNERN